MQLPQLTFTRFLAAVSIVVLHFGLRTWPFNTEPVILVFGKAISAVSYFFILSGFILVIASSKDARLPKDINTVFFWKKRAARILPVYLFSVLLFFVINFQYDPSVSIQWQTHSYFYSALLIQSWIYRIAFDVNYPAWTLSAEAFFYFIFPWIYGNLINLSNKRLLLIGVILWYGNTYIFRWFLSEGFPHNIAFYSPLMHVATFVTGVCSGILFVRNFELLCGRYKIYINGLTILAFVFMLYSAYTNANFFMYQHNGFLTPFFILVFYSLSVSTGFLTTIFSSKIFVFLGDISYSIYLFQFIILQICQKYIPWFQNKEPKDYFYSYLLILICFSAFIYLILEKPARNYFSPKRKLVI